MLTVCTAHLGFAIETYPTWRHESRCPSEERKIDETFWPDTILTTKRGAYIAWRNKSYQETRAQNGRDFGEKGEKLAENTTIDPK